MRAGFTLVEVLVALVLFEVGMLGALGLLATSSRWMTRAERLEVAVATVEGVADSLSAVQAAIGAGSSSIPPFGSVAWSGPGPDFAVVFLADGDTLLRVEGRQQGWLP